MVGCVWVRGEIEERVVARRLHVACAPPVQLLIESRKMGDGGLGWGAGKGDAVGLPPRLRISV